MEGQGKLYYSNGQLAYDGEWLNNQFNGKGIVLNEEPQPLDQDFNFEDFDQLGEHWKSYEGDFVLDSKEGMGTLLLINGEKYIGSFKEDMIHGEGEFHKTNGEVISGQWNLNQFV